MSLRDRENQINRSMEKSNGCVHLVVFWLLSHLLMPVMKFITQTIKEKEIYKQGATLGAGIAGGAAGGTIAGGICGPGSPICSTVGVIIGEITAYQLVEAFDEELEAFTKWTLF